jgi:hypothetical protein
MTPTAGGATLALAPSTRGLGFVVFDQSYFLLDWGVKEVRSQDKNFRSLSLAKTLMEQHAPAVLVIEGTTRKSRRHERIRILLGLLAAEAKARHIRVQRFTQGAVLEHFGVHTKYAIAEAVSLEIPTLALRLPRKRKPWMSEDARQSLFDAAALGVVYLARVAAEEMPSAMDGAERTGS